MKISIHGSPEGAVIDVTGRLVHGEPVHDLHDGVKDLIARGVTEVVVNLSEATNLDSVGIETLIACYTTCKRNGKRFKVVNPNDRAKRVLHVTKLDELFGVSPAN